MVKLLVYKLIAFLGILGYIVLQSTPEVLSAECNTFSIHSPIYPAENIAVTYTLLDISADNGVQSIKLIETVYNVNDSGVLSQVTPPTPIKEWDTPPFPPPPHLAGAHNAGEFITYKFEVTDLSGDLYPNSNIIGYAINPYPPSTASEQPAPVYVQEDVGVAMDIVFIPDKDVPNMPSFYDNCFSMIKDGILEDIRSHDMTKSLLRYFNFFINPQDGITTAFPYVHVKPSNWDNLTFTDAQVIMHENDIRDHAEGTLCSTEQINRGTMLHEVGHALFGLADEYKGGGHYQAPYLPNNWNNRRDARSDAPLRHKKHNNVDRVQKNVYKVCNTTCQMSKSGLTIVKYDVPCRDRVEYAIKTNANITYPLTFGFNFEPEYFTSTDNEKQHIMIPFTVTGTGRLVQSGQGKLRPGPFPYSNKSNGDTKIVFLNSEEEEIGHYYIENPATTRHCYNSPLGKGKGKRDIRKKQAGRPKAEILIPADINIASIDIIYPNRIDLAHVKPIAINNVPSLGPIADIVVKASDPVTINPAVSDPEGDPLDIKFDRWKAGSFPGTYTTTAADVGIHEVEVTVTETNHPGNNLSAKQVVTVTVLK